VEFFIAEMVKHAAHSLVGAVMRDRSRDVDRNQDVRPESGYTIRVMSFDQSWEDDQSHAYDRSCDIPIS
jgi:hypothetical protein